MKLMFKRAARYQSGSLTIEKRKTGPAVWVYRWREAVSNGRSTHRKMLVGTREQYPTQRAAMRAVEGLRLDINAETAIIKQRNLTVADLWSHYSETELADDRLSPSTKGVYRQYFERHIRPVWADHRLQDVGAVPVERWLADLSYAPGTKAKVRNILSALYQHAVRQGWIDRNPIRNVRQSAKRQAELEILEPTEIQALLKELPEPCKTMAMVAALTGLRVSEILGLQWQDMDLDEAVLRLRRGVVNQQVTALKTVGSRRPLPIPVPLVEALSRWKAQAYFTRPEHWVFASPHSDGEKPYWPGTLLQKVVQPAARRVGIAKQVGWHSFRRSFATLLYREGENVKVTQDLMRHSTPTVTMGVYVQAITAEKRQAQDRIAGLILGLDRSQGEQVQA